MVELKLTLVILGWQKAAVSSGSCIADVEFLECKLGGGLMYILVARMSEKNTQHFCVIEVKMTQHFSVFELKMTLTGLASSYLAFELLPYYDTY